MKNSTRAAMTANVALLSALLSIIAPPDDGRHDVIGERDDAAEDQGSGEETHQPDRLERLHRVDKRDLRVIPLPALPETAEPESDKEAQAADHYQPEAPVGQRLAVQPGIPHARNNVVGARDGEEREAAE